MAINYRSDEAAAAAVAGHVGDAGAEVEVIRADVAKGDDVERMFRTVDERFGRLDVLVNNAGILHRQMHVVDMDEARLVRTFQVNVVGAFLCAREAIRRMSTRSGGGGGSIINVSSIAATLGGGGQYVDYAASKGAIDTMTIGLARELAAEGIRVNAVRPGIIDTDIHADGGDPDRWQRAGSSIPMGRGGTAEEIASAVMWLASGAAGYVTGALLDVSGGR